MLSSMKAALLQRKLQSRTLLGFACSLVVVSVMGQAASYSITDLGLGTANDINSAGHVAASVNNQAVVFDGYTNHVLPPAELGWNPVIFNEATALHDTGLVVMTGQFGGSLDGTDLVFYWGGGIGRVTGANAHRVVSGYYFSGSHRWPVQGFIGTSAANLVRLDYASRLNDVNDAGVAVGMASTEYVEIPDWPSSWKGYYAGKAFRLIDQTPEFIDSRPTPQVWPPTSDLSEALNINESGVIVGWRREVAPGNRHAFRYDGTTMTDLGTLGGSESVAHHVNEFGHVVGWSHTADGSQRAFLHRDGVMVDLDTLLPAESGWTLTVARSINDVGQIVGEGLYQGATHAFLLSPPGLDSPPRITQQPAGGVFGLGASHTLQVAAHGTPPLTYQWRKDGLDLDGAVAETLPLDRLTAFDAGTYRVRVANAGGIIFSVPVAVQVLDPVVAIKTFAGIMIYGEVGATYEVEYKDHADAAWLLLSPGVVLTNSPQVVLDSTPIQGHRIYRALRLP
jgi:probable HAF family extracellular repeat protein